MESNVPYIADTQVAIDGTQSISYDLSGDIGDIVQRVDRQYQIGELFQFARPLLAGNDVSIVTRGGKDGYSCYVKGNEFVFLAPDLTSGYTDRKHCFLVDIFDAVQHLPIIALQNSRTYANVRCSFLCKYSS